MAISNEHFGAEIINKKGNAFTFDDMRCVLGFIKSGSIVKNVIKEVFVVNFEEPHNFIPASKAFLLKSPALHSPMGGNIACFDDQLKFEEAMKKFKGEEISWNTLLNAE
jgi:copper chaperone NosL